MGKQTYSKQDQRESLELAKFGYQQQLRRTMGGFSSFAISFSLISIITGIFANFSFGIQQVGGGLIWSWSLVALGQLVVALVMADLSTRFPLAGYGYQWTSRLTNAHFGYFVGWLLLMQFITGFPGVSQALAVTVDGLMGGNNSTWTVTLITVGIISLTALIHLYGIRLVSLVNDIGVYAEIIGSILVIMVLWGLWVLAGEFDFSNFLDSRNAYSSKPYGFSAFALSLLVGAWCLTGFEAAADLAEETHQPRKTVPRAVITSQVSAAVAGLLMIMAFLLSLESIPAGQQSSNPLVMVLETKLGQPWTSITGMVIVMSIFACGVACMATATRLIYSLARDNMLPFSNFLKSVDEKYQSPRKATLVVWALGCLFIVSIRHLEMVTSISAVAGYLGYCGIMVATLLTKKEEPRIEGFSLGRFRKPLRIIALIWTFIVVLALTIPEYNVDGMLEKHLPAKSTLAAVVLGVIIYILIIRNRIINRKAGPPA